jgi:hypothetical protein
MKYPAWKAAGLLGLGALGVWAVQAAEPTVQAHLNVKLGLWEMVTKPQVTGDMAAMAAPDMANMTPEQRARMQQAMQAAMASMQEPRVIRECMTAEKLSRGFNIGNDNCKTTVVKNSSTEFEVHGQCAERDGAHTVVAHFTALSSDHVVGTAHSDMSHNGSAMSFDAKMEGKWLSADCGNVKDSEVVKGPK